MIAEPTTETAGSDPASPVLRCSDIRVTFGGVHAVEDVSLTVGAGEIVGLIGPNGAGKTTLVNALTGVVKPSRGRVVVGGVDTTGRGPAYSSNRGVGRTFQAARLFGELTALENLEVAARRRGVSRRDAKSLALEYLDWSGLGSRSEIRADSLAYGEERLLALARALVQKPKVLLLDEPAAGMAEAETDHLARLIVQIRDDLGIGVLLIEHDMRLVMTTCDRLHVLDNGVTLAAGTPKEVRENPAVVNAYLGTSATRIGDEDDA